MEQVQSGIVRHGGSIYTRNLVPGETVYGEELVDFDGDEYRRWDPYRSKAAAALEKDIGAFPIDAESEVLYLGASTGTTVSHLSDIAVSGMIYGVEYAGDMVRKLVKNIEARENVAPIMGDARKPREYRSLCSQVDVIYQDVAQPDQVEILRRNAEMFLKEGGHAMIAIKAQSISSSDSPEEVFGTAKEKLEERFDILAGKKLEPFHTDHLFLTLRDRSEARGL